MVCNFGLVKEIVIRKDYKSTCSIIMETSENQEQDMQCGEVDVESVVDENEIQNVEKNTNGRGQH